MTGIQDIESHVYDWCTREARGSPSARALAAIYASTYMDSVPLVNFRDLRALDDTRMDWAVKLIRGYVEGSVQVPWPRAVALVALYDLIPIEPEAEILEPAPNL